ncbi:MAG: glucose dehydrogenase [Chloroflexi bacterium]|nr:glucose dehydrogenase [Chloroflexota bacterium]
MLLLAACGGDSNRDTPTTAVASPSEVIAQPSSTAVATPSPESSPTLVATETQSSTPLPTVAPLPTPEPVPTQPAPVFPPAISLEPFIVAPNQITYLTHAGDDSGRLFLVEKAGRVRIIGDGRVLETPYLDITDLVASGGSEQGLLSIAFPPDFTVSRVFYVNYTDRAGDGDTVIARYHLSSDSNIADAMSGQILLTVDQPAANHNGGQIQFGPDGYLYVGTGDGGRANDPWDNAENLSVLLGKMLRLDVENAETYAVPASNPFVQQDGLRPEIWAYGLRNPWRFSFDRATGDMYIADVGQNRWEEISIQPAASAGGEHYGWDTMEGRHCFEPANGCNRSDKELPVAEYGHDQGCSITGGYVYRGQQYPAWDGTYFYADYCNGRIWAMRQHDSGDWLNEFILDSGINIASFAEDESGELYVLDLGGTVYRLLASP